MREFHKKLTAEGVDSYIFWGRRHETISDHEQCCATNLGVYLHGLRARLTDRIGFYSKKDTKRLLKKLDEIDPDVVHLHNIHGYYINLELLFNWLANHPCQVKWTLHDCWSFTGHCAYFTYAKCTQWQSHCAYFERCPQQKEYPKSFLCSAAKKNFTDKKRLFTSIPKDRLTLIAPSRWLANLVARSFLADYKTEVIHNEIDRSVFRPIQSSFREVHDLEGKFVILGVASPWTERKGLKDFEILLDKLDGRFAIVLVGLSPKQIEKMKDRVPDLTGEVPLSDELTAAIREITKRAMLYDFGHEPGADFLLGLNGCLLLPFERTESQSELAGMYSAADLFLNPTQEDNYPTVNLEAEACGTPVLTYRTGGCEETLNLAESCAVGSGFEGL